jgi:hypothetical protein
LERNLFAQGLYELLIGEEIGILQRCDKRQAEDKDDDVQRWVQLENKTQERWRLCNIDEDDNAKATILGPDNSDDEVLSLALSKRGKGNLLFFVTGSATCR